MRVRSRALLATLAVAIVAGHASAAPAPASPLLAGLRAWSAKASERCASGAWLFPVGDSLDFSRATGGVPAYAVNRGVRARGAEGGEHDGADLANGRAGDPVRAAANGVVLLAAGGERGGYGTTIVLAHRIDDGTLAYSVYSHLLAGSLRVHEGDAVEGGQPIARVGQTGRATTPHLHFEVRVPRDTTLRWEHCPVVDPIAFVRDRLPAAAGPAWAAPYVQWAELSAFVPRGVDATAPLTAALFHQVLGRAGLADDDSGAADDTLANLATAPRPDWNAIARAIGELRTRRLHLPPLHVDRARHTATCAQRLGTRRPVRDIGKLAGREQPATVGELCLLLADLAGKR